MNIFCANRLKQLTAQEPICKVVYLIVDYWCFRNFMLLLSTLYVC